MCSDAQYYIHQELLQTRDSSELADQASYNLQHKRGTAVCQDSKALEQLREGA